MFNKKISLVALLMALASELMAGTLVNYAVGDVLVCFRSSGGVNDLVVDAGPISTFTNFPANSTNLITQFAGNQLALVGTNSASWSAFTWFDDTVSPVSAQWELFMTRPRTSLNTRTSPWSNAQNNKSMAGDLGSIPPGAAGNITFNGLNTSTAVIEPDSSASYLNGQSYHTTIDPNGTGDFNFGGDFQGDPENTTPLHFTTSGTVVRSDFYQTSLAGSGVGKFLGYFEFSTNGVMTYVAFPSPVVATPSIVSIVRTGTTNTITFTTGSSGTYSLCGTNNLTAPRGTWPVIASISGNNGNRSLTDVDAGGIKFYLISAQ